MDNYLSDLTPRVCSCGSWTGSPALALCEACERLQLAIELTHAQARDAHAREVADLFEDAR